MDFGLSCGWTVGTGKEDLPFGHDADAGRYFNNLKKGKKTSNESLDEFMIFRDLDYEIKVDKQTSLPKQKK